MTTTSASRWQFWIDVGGTFTDCFGRMPDGELRRHKVLSSGITKGSAAADSSAAAIVDPLRRNDPADFWTGYRFRLLDAEGRAVAETTVAAFDARHGRLSLAEPLAVNPAPNQAYELDGGEESPILAIRYLLGLRLSDTIEPVAVRLGTTRGTNALITRRGARTALVTTKGFGDVLRIGYQNRPRLFDLAIRKPPPLFAHVVEIDERIAADGSVLVAPNADAVRRDLAALKTEGIDSLAICLMHAYQSAEHEQIVARIAREVGFDEISVSSQVAPLVKIVSRGDTTVMDAYLNPILRRYVAALRTKLGDSDLRVITSAGGLVTADKFVGKDSILSGPAGGVVGFSRVAQAAGFDAAIGFDMGGTSTDVARFDGRYELEYETEKAGVRVVAPMMSIETVAAGGGSICAFDGVKLVVGPDSAGANPGPACYGRGGPLAVTDINFYLGKIPPEFFPFPLDRPAVERRLSALIDEIAAATGKRYEPVELANGFLRVANANMVKAIRSISVAKGYNPRDYVLVAFGGAAGQHACAVARELGMERVLLHPDAGILSAYGIGMAEIARHGMAGVYRPYSEGAVAALGDTFAELAAPLAAEVECEGIARERIEVRRALDLRYRGLDAYLTVREPSNTGSNTMWGGTGSASARTYADAFAAEHRQLYGYVHENRPLEIVAARVEVVGHSADAPRRSQSVEPRTVRGERTVTAWFDAKSCATDVHRRDDLRPGDRIVGPAIVHESTSTVVIDPAWQADVLSGGELLLSFDKDAARQAEPVGGSALAKPVPPHEKETSVEADPVLLEIFNNQFAGIAEQMGITLRNTSSSVNVKERLDFSCAIFTATGDLVVNAPHIPVHLGAMSETVKRIIADNAEIRRGDVFVTNDPYRGGSHLPDVTVVTPVHDEAGGELLFFTASRAHHAEIGGITPGSMPPFSKNLAEEGVLIRNFKLVDAGRSRADVLRELLVTAPHPTRSVDDNLADIAAQVAANNQGVRDLGRMVARYTLPVTLAYMRHIQAAAERKMRTALAKLNPGRREFTDHLDDGSPIRVAITVGGTGSASAASKGDCPSGAPLAKPVPPDAIIDFTGTGPVLAGNLNANRAITSAAVLYVLRLLIAEDIPLNQGVLAPVSIVLPECFLNPPEKPTAAECAAVVGGNVETSQRIVDTLLGALGIAAASQGTMNNLLFGDKTFGYYETICGGSGATANADGADAVHTHMTNTRLTDPEVLERRYPVRLVEFAIRRGSGGAGKHRGGDGVVRRIEFLRPLDLSILSQRRGPYAPYGQNGGQPGKLGRNTLVRRDGTIEVLPALAARQVEAGDTLVIETPGGGGWAMS
ncbi:MAG: hydantoinase [Planctomycetota bacterium]|nr:MAG: hydantoinase [Planctomycetota bacterium]